jgi:cobalamin-dependent methionine synthase I
VAYARDAFDGLDLMNKVVVKGFDAHVEASAAKRESRPSNTKRVLGQAARPLRPVDVDEVRLRRAELARGYAVPTPPFWGARMVERMPVRALIPYLNETMLFQFQWGFRKAGKSIDEWKRWSATEVRPILRRMLELCEREDILQPQACYGYWRCVSEGDSVVLLAGAEGHEEIARFAFPRQAREGGSWHVRVSLAQTGRWLWNLGRLEGGLATEDLKADAVLPFIEQLPSGFGLLRSVRHAAVLSRTTAHWYRPAMPLGSHPPEFPAQESSAPEFPG